VALMSGTGSAAARNGVVIPATPGQPRPLAGTIFHSANWSGYVVTSRKHRITAVSSSFTVPSPGVPTGFASNWTGIGGFGTTDLIQAGTSEFFATTENYFAWYELLPGSSKQLHNCTGDPLCTVTAGDQMSVNIKQMSSGHWRITVADSSNGWTWTKKVSYTSSRSSAEWILEAPTVGGAQSTLPHGLGTSLFGPTSTYTVSSTSHTIAQGNPITVVMDKRNGSREATPSPLAADGESFNACVYTSSCATP
jgi:Peptidase A4 family